jgi:hypothetical protein
MDCQSRVDVSELDGYEVDAMDQEHQPDGELQGSGGLDWSARRAMRWERC